jgi:predicted amidohydrolase
VAALQSRAEPKAYAENRERAEALLRAVAAKRPDVVVMPELFLHGHGYQADRNKDQEPLHGPTLAWMQKLSRELGALLVGGINETIEGDERCHGTLLLVDGDELLGVYRKRHPAGAEALFMKPGSEPAVIDTRLGRIALITCFDMSFPECATAAFERRADLLLVSNAWIDMGKFSFLAGRRFEHHTVLPRALAMQLRAPAVVSNLVGPTATLVPGLASLGGGAYPFDTEFTGDSMICDHMGEVLEMRKREQGEGFVVADVNLTLARSTREVTVGTAGIEGLRKAVFKR